LGYEQPPTYTFNFWQAYTIFCRDLAAKTRVSIRELDRALWAFEAVPVVVIFMV